MLPYWLSLALYILCIYSCSWTHMSASDNNLISEQSRQITQSDNIDWFDNIWRAEFQNLLHPLLHVTHMQLWSQQNLLQVESVVTTEILEYRISTNSNSAIRRTAFWPCYKTYIHKEVQNNKVLFGYKTSSIHFCMPLIPTFNMFNHFVHFA